MPFYVGAAHTRDLLKKVDQNFHTFGECEHPHKSQFPALRRTENDTKNEKRGTRLGASLFVVVETEGLEPSTSRM